MKIIYARSGIVADWENFAATQTTRFFIIWWHKILCICFPNLKHAVAPGENFLRDKILISER